MQFGSSDLSYSDMICIQCLIYLFSEILLGLLPSSNVMPQVSPKPSKLGRGLRTHYVNAPTGKADPCCSRACSWQDVSQLLPANWPSAQNTNLPETSQSGRNQINTLIETISSSVFLLIFNSLHINSTGFLSWKDRASIKNKLPNGTAPLLTIKNKTTKMRIQVLIHRQQNSPWV